MREGEIRETGGSGKSDVRIIDWRGERVRSCFSRFKERDAERFCQTGKEADTGRERERARESSSSNLAASLINREEQCNPQE